MKTKPRKSTDRPAVHPSVLAMLDSVWREHSDGMKECDRRSRDRVKTGAKGFDPFDHMIGRHLEATNNVIAVMSRLQPQSQADVVVLLRAAMRQLSMLAGTDCGSEEDNANLDAVRRIVCQIAIFNGMSSSETYGHGEFEVPNPFAEAD